MRLRNVIGVLGMILRPFALVLVLPGLVDLYFGRLSSAFDGFAELKKSLRERPQLNAYGLADGSVGKVEDWHGGSRRQKK